MKRFLLIVCLLALAAVAADSPRVAAGPQDIGRYQLLHAVVAFRAPRGHADFNTVFKLDSVTGRTWRYVDIVSKTGVLTHGWVELEDLIPLDTNGFPLPDVFDGISTNKP